MGSGSFAITNASLTCPCKSGSGEPSSPGWTNWWRSTRRSSRYEIHEGLFFREHGAANIPLIPDISPVVDLATDFQSSLVRATSPTIGATRLMWWVADRIRRMARLGRCYQPSVEATCSRLWTATG